MGAIVPRNAEFEPPAVPASIPAAATARRASRLTTRQSSNGTRARPSRPQRQGLLPRAGSGGGIPRRASLTRRRVSFTIASMRTSVRPVLVLAVLAVLAALVGGAFAGTEAGTQ